QRHMLRRLKELRNLASLGEQKLAGLSEQYVKKAETFLAAIALPDGNLPMVGDTAGNIEKPFIVHNVTTTPYVLYDYSRSGYVIAKGTSASGDLFYILHKNCHDSNYHRHD